MKLTDAKVRAARPTPGAARTKIADGKGLALEIDRLSGDRYAKRWTLRYRLRGVEKRMVLGTYPELTLNDARERSAKARREVADGGDPLVTRQREQERRKAVGDGTFADVAAATLEAKREGWTPGYAAKWWRYIEADLIPSMGARAVADITAQDLLREIRRIEARGVVEIAKRVMKGAEAVFSHALALGMVERNPVLDVLPLIKTAPPPKPHAAVFDRKALGAMLRDLRDYASAPGRHIFVQHAALAQFHTAQRPAMVNGMRWEHIDLKRREWRVPLETMKGRLAAKVRAAAVSRVHVVPLSRQMMTIIEAQRAAVPDDVPFVFPSTVASRQRTTPISENTVGHALQRLGFEQSAHGTRSLFLTLMQEDAKVAFDHLDPVLAHGKSGVRGAYDHAQFLEERPAIMQRWSDLLDALRDGGKVLPMRRKSAA
ncbi:phage integrase central domain-containing protein [Variovorax sp. Sphag1AA]|uniref:tyrosine-type recombinase/integrase n=1 Tax=Variovorax sp. Sphag1AA TaxID=2587027 RepID=UPI001607D8B4|nr:integrase arm-type DNA-binding domain-containing protein [Variovorax sp. Sphag1AA]MBB3180098.1 integrase [Variovorax sp. Sphag1AA]